MNPRAYLDIETDRNRRITVVGVYRPDYGPKQWVAPDLSGGEIRDYLQGIAVLFTYNGARFDLPIIKDQLKVDLVREFRHQDLMYDCWSRCLFGGLKKVEVKLGIHRDTVGVDGLEAISLWERFVGGEKAALEKLLHYNREDVENLENLALRLGIVTPGSAAPRFEPAKRPDAAGGAL